jgi:acetyl esterase
MSPIDPRAQALLDEWASSPAVPVAQLTPRIVRESDRAVEALQPPPERVRRVENHLARTLVGDIPIRIFVPLDGEPPYPMLIYFHGGGFVIGIDSYESPLRALANQTRHALCAIEYRLAPEHQFPAAVDDAFAAAEWLVRHAVDLACAEDRVSVAGDSSGGNLAAVVALLNRDRQAFRLRRQVLIYPMLDASCSQPSARLFATGLGFTTEKIAWYFDQYLPRHADRRDPRISPLFATVSQDLPPAFIATAEFDPLRDEAEVYSRLLRSAGVPTTLKRYSGMIHGFLQMGGRLNQARMLMCDVGAALEETSPCPE